MTIPYNTIDSTCITVRSNTDQKLREANSIVPGHLGFGSTRIQLGGQKPMCETHGVVRTS